MALEKIKELLDTVRTDPKAQEALQGLDKPADREGIIQFILAAAKKLGVGMTEDEIREAVEQEEIHRREKTQAAAQGIEDLSDEEVEQAAGGFMWDGDDASDGHEMGCWFTWHGYEWQKEHEEWCKNNYFCNGIVVVGRCINLGAS